MGKNLEKKVEEKLLIGIAIFLSYVLSSIVIDNIYTLFLQNYNIQKQLVNIIINILLLVVLILFYKKTFIKEIKEILENKIKYLRILIKYGIFVTACSFLIAFIESLIFSVATEPENTQYLISFYKETPFILLFLGVIYYPIIEGIVFRKTIKDIIDNKKVFIIFTALIYWLFNILFSTISLQNIIFTFYCFINMLIVSYVYVKYNNLSISILIQMLYSIIILSMKQL